MMKHRFLPLVAILMVMATGLRAEQMVFSKVMYHPPDGLPEYIEVLNNTATPLDMSLWRLRGGVDYDFPDFSAGDPTLTFARPFERFLISPVDPATLRAAYGIPASIRIYGPWTGSLNNAGESIVLRDRNQVPLCELTYNDRGRWPVSADGAGHALELIDPNGTIDDWRNWRASERRLGAPGSGTVQNPETPISNPEVDLSQGIPLVEYGDSWRYHAGNVDLGTAWRASAFNDASWAQGPGLLGFENSALPAPGLQTDLSAFDANQLTYYFRKEFTYNGSLVGVNITIDSINDDGAVYYLNGIELGRVGVGGGTVTFTTTANRTVGDATEELGVITTSGSALVNGRNVLAVEAHQTNPTSSDLIFGCRFKVSVPSQPSIVINEVLPGGAGTGFVEFFNPGGAPVNLRDHYVSDDAGNLDQFQIPTDLIIPSGGLATIGFTESGMSISDPTSVFLVDPDGVTVVNAVSSSVPLDGRSIGRKPAGSGLWFIFVDPSPGSPNTSEGAATSSIRMNEVHFTGNTVDWVEFHNRGEAGQSLSGLFLASLPDLSDKVPLQGTASVGGYISQDFAFPVIGDDIALYLVNGSDLVLQARIFDRPGIGSSQQAFPPGADEWYASAADSRDAANNPVRNTDVVINEIMYDPPSDEVAAEFIEIHNRGAAPVDLSGWRLREAVDFDIPFGTTLPPDGYLVIAADEDWIRLTYGNIPVVGNLGGRLSNNGDLIRLLDQWGNLADEVDYKAGGGPGSNWPKLAHGDGSSMELLHPFMDNSLSSAWDNSDNTNSTSFQAFSYTDIFRQLTTRGGATDYKELHFFLVGDGHVVLENIQVRLNGTGPNLIVNGNQMSGNGASANGWLAQGTHYATYIDPQGRLNIVSDGHGDNRPNRVEIDVTAMNSGSSYTMTFNARWVSGTPRLIMQTWDHSIAASFSVPIPRTLGTPGLRNSKALALARAQVDELIHSPAVPTSTEPVKVTARITSPGPAQVLLFHRADNNTGSAPWQSKAMFDDGFNGGDEISGDGIHTATLTEHQVNGRVVQFYVRAVANGSEALQPRPGALLPAMYVVDTPTAAGDLRTMRFVVSQLSLDTINQGDSTSPVYGSLFPRLANHYYNMTMIVNEKEITYGCEIRNSGSPWTRGGIPRGKFKLPSDARFRGQVKLSWDNDAEGGSRHHNRLTRYWLHLLGHPVNENEYVRVEINSGGSALKEEVEVLGNRLLDRNYENGADGELYRIDDEWWFDDAWGRQSRNADWTYKGSDNAGRYRTEWMRRSREDDDDHSSLIGLFRKLSQGYTQAEIERLVDGDAVMLMSAVRGYIYDWDSFSLDRGKNGYMYRRSTDGRFIFWHWDSDLAFRGGDVNNGFENGMAGFNTYIDQPYNKRIFKHYLAQLVEKYARNSAHLNAWIAAEEGASSQYSISSSYLDWVANRETPANNYLGANRSVAFNITTSGGGPITTSASTVNLAGISPLRVHSIEVAGHPEAEFSWTSETGWSLTGILLRSGANILTLNGIDSYGRVLHTDLITVNRNGNAPPIMALEGNPDSFRTPLIEVFEVTAEESYDPDGTPLSFIWSVSPSDQVLLDASGGSNAIAIFPRPGLYEITAAGLDGGGASASVTREAAVYGPGGFDPFNDPRLPSVWREENVQIRENFMPGAYYSLTEFDGQLILQILDDSARSLQTGSPGYPYLWRELPPLTDWAWFSKASLRAQVFGDYMTGIMVEILEGGSAIRYAFGIENGNLLSAKRILANGTVSSLLSQPLSGPVAEIRIRREGSSLHFEELIDDEWVSRRVNGIPAGALARKAGLFTATDVVQRVKTAFDFALLVDPSATSELRENLRLTEIMYDPDGGNLFEFVELLNIGETPLDLTDVAFTAGIGYTFGSVVLGPREYIVVVADQASFASRYTTSGINIAAGSFTGRLDGDGETIELSDRTGAVILSVSYGVDGDWPAGAKNTGNSLEVGDPAGNLNDGRNWRESPEEGGSPGRETGGSVGTVVVNEVLSHSDAPLEDAIELHNRTGASIDISGWFLSDSSADGQRFRIPNGTSVPAGGFKVFYEQDFNTGNPLVPFSLNSAAGDQVYLSAADLAGTLTGYRTFADFGAAENGVSFGAYETTQGRHFTAMESRTFGADAPATLLEFRTGNGLANSAPRVGPVVINELMYHPPDIDGTNDNTLDEYIELYNITSGPVDLFDPAFPTNTWRVRGGVDYDFPEGVTLPGHGHLLLVSFDPVAAPATLTAFRASYGLPATVTVLGPYSGLLANSEESVRLRKPDAPQGPGPDMGFVPSILVDSVAYSDAAPWPAGPDGTGESLQRRRPHEYGDDPVNWKAAAPSPGGANVAGAGLTDSDGDGIGDDWETANGFDINDPADAGENADGDLRTNYEEYLDGTDPRDSGDQLVAPAITAQPMNQVSFAGGGALFSVSAAGTAPISYQWRVNGELIPGETSGVLMLTGVQGPDAGSYTVVVQNPAGFVISAPASLTVNQPLDILGQPASRVVQRGADVSFNVFALGTGPLTYQWRRNGVNLAGATGDTLTLLDVDPFDGGDYTVVVTDDNTSLTSATANLLVLTPPTILRPPASLTEVAYMDVTFDVLAGGDGPLSYQWRVNGVNMEGQTNSILVLFDVQPGQAGAYSVVVSNPSSSVTSADAILTLLIPATIVQHPVSVTVDPGQNVSFNIVATSSTPMTYQWRLNGIAIPGATAQVLDVPNAQAEDDGIYTCVVTDTVGAIESDGARLAVLIDPVFLVRPQPVMVVEGGDLILSVETSGTLPMGYRWRQNGGTVKLEVIDSHLSFYIVRNVDESVEGAYTVVATNAASYTPGVISGASVQVTVLTDEDGDGIPDDYEDAHGLNASDPADAAQDPDMDGKTTLEEYLSGTDHLDGDSVLRIDDITHDGLSLVQFTAFAGQTYTLQSAPTPFGPWTRFEDFAAGPVDRALEVRDLLPNGQQRYYRLTSPLWIP